MLVENLNFQLLVQSVSENVKTYNISRTEKNGLANNTSPFKRLRVKRLELDEPMEQQSRQLKNKTFLRKSETRSFTNVYQTFWHRDENMSCR